MRLLHIEQIILAFPIKKFIIIVVLLILSERNINEY